MTLTFEQIQEIISSLQDTCNELNSFVVSYINSEFNDTNSDLIDSEDEIENWEEFNEYLDNELFLCDDCGWWYEVCERSENDNCEDCDESQQ